MGTVCELALHLLHCQEGIGRCRCRQPCCHDVSKANLPVWVQVVRWLEGKQTDNLQAEESMSL